jgi:predicted alpha/beta-fold hydrolase
LKAKAERQIVRFPGAFDIEAVRTCIKIGDFDDIYIARIYKFADKFDYYRKSGSKWWLPFIKVPTIAINARDDPFIEESSLPTENDIGDAPVRLIYHDHGGHCGFLASNSTKSHGWLAEELGLALEHIHTSTKAVVTTVNTDEERYARVVV